MTEEVDDAQLAAAIDRIARSEDGLSLYRYCQKRLSSITLAGSSNELVQRNEGAREFAGALMGLMAEGVDYSGRGSTVVFRTGGRTKPDDEQRVRVRPDGRREYRPIPGGRRIDERTFVSGFDGPANDPTDGPDAGSDREPA